MNWPGASTGWSTTNPLQKQSAQAQQNGLSHAEIGRLIASDAATQWQDFLRGLWLYQHHLAQRIETAWDVVWTRDAVALKRLPSTRRKTRGTVLLIPSLINRFHILDLHPDQSFARFMQSAGYDVHLLDWQHDTTQALPVSLESCVADYIGPALQKLQGPVHVIGYCMGGTLSVLAAQQQPKLIRSLTLLATPWDFHQPDGGSAQRFAAALETASAGATHVTADWLQMLFSQRDVLAALRKFQNFAHQDMQGARAVHFVLAEDWLNDGVDLPSSLLRECAARWYRDNRPAHETDLQMLRHLPTQIITADRDRLVPTASAQALQEKLPHAVCQTFATGHIGLFAGRLAHDTIWPQVQHFLDVHNV